MFPLIKTGGLADVAYHLPKALQHQGYDMRIIMPGYRDALARSGSAREVAHLQIDGHALTVLEAELFDSPVKIWLLKTGIFSDRSGDPYTASSNDPLTQREPWHDNAQRFNLFCHAVSIIAQGLPVLQWQADIVHCNDWQTGLVPVYLSALNAPPPTVFTIHNLAYQGLFSYETFLQLRLDPSLWHFTSLEFHERLSFIKGGLVFSDWVNTVSPRYAHEIQTPAFGHGLDGLLRHRNTSLSGILNGIDRSEWNPTSDQYLPQNYGTESIDSKTANKIFLQSTHNLAISPSIPLLGWVGRLAEQKGIDMLLEALPKLLQSPVQLVLLGSGDREIEAKLNQLALRFPDQVAVVFDYDEAVAHQVIASSDFFLMPSRFEPCGLTQLYSLRYGTIPIAHKVGGLADTIVNITQTSIANQTATGFLFEPADTKELLETLGKALKLYANQAVYRSIQLTAMKQNFSWQPSAEEYSSIYNDLYQKSNQFRACQQTVATVGEGLDSLP